MADYKRTEVPEDVILHISPSRNTVVVQEHSANGVVSYREIDPIEFYFALNGSYTTNDYLDSGFLPEHCLHIAMNAAERRYVIWNPELRADVIYRDTEYLDFPLPRLVFSLRVLADGRVADCSMGVVADEPPTEDTNGASDVSSTASTPYGWTLSAGDAATLLRLVSGKSWMTLI